MPWLHQTALGGSNVWPVATSTQCWDHRASKCQVPGAPISQMRRLSEWSRGILLPTRPLHALA